MKIQNILLNKKLMANAFSLWLKKHRAESGLTLIQLRDKIGNLCSDAYLSKLENDRYKGKKGRPAQPDIEIVEALAAALHRPTDEARLAAGYAPATAPIVSPQILDALRRVSPLAPADAELLANFILMLGARSETPDAAPKQNAPVLTLYTGELTEAPYAGEIGDVAAASAPAANDSGKKRKSR